MDGMPRGSSAPSQRYGAARSIIQKTLPAAATHVARKSFLHCKISFTRRNNTTYVASLSYSLDQRQSRILQDQRQWRIPQT
jgi:hypothetical protein